MIGLFLIGFTSERDQPQGLYLSTCFKYHIANFKPSFGQIPLKILVRIALFGHDYI